MTQTNTETSGLTAPKATFGLLSFNQSDCIARALECVLLQRTIQPLEIVVLDDGSTDETPQVIQSVLDAYNGPHQVKNLSTSTPVGQVHHINQLFQQATGEVIFFSTASAYTLPVQVTETMKVFRHFQSTSAVHSPVYLLGPQGKRRHIQEPAFTPPTADALMLSNFVRPFLPAPCAYRKSVFEYFGPIEHTPSYPELVMTYRAALLGRLHRMKRPFVEAKPHPDSTPRNTAHSRSNYQKARLHDATCKTGVLMQLQQDLKKTRAIDSNKLHKELNRELTRQTLTAHFYEPGTQFLKALFSRQVGLGLQVALRETINRFF